MTKKIIIIDRKEFLVATFVFPLFAIAVNLSFAYFDNKFAIKGVWKVLLDSFTPVLIFMLLINTVIYFKYSHNDKIITHNTKK